MTMQEVLDSTDAMPLTSPAYPKPPHRFVADLTRDRGEVVRDYLAARGQRGGC